MQNCKILYYLYIWYHSVYISGVPKGSILRPDTPTPTLSRVIVSIKYTNNEEYKVKTLRLCVHFTI